MSQRAVEILARTALEGAARSWWLLDPDIDYREMVTRGVGEALAGLRADVHVASKTGNQRSRKRAQDWADAAIEWARSLNLPLKVAKSGIESLAGYRRPTATEVAELLLRAIESRPTDASAYSYWSGAIHSSAYHRIALGGRATEAIESSMGSLSSALTVVVRALSAAHMQIAYYLGSESSSRARPYDDVLNYLDNLPSDDDELVIGIL